MAQFQDDGFMCVTFPSFFCSSVKICTMMIEGSSDPSRSQFICIHRVAVATAALCVVITVVSLFVT